MGSLYSILAPDGVNDSGEFSFCWSSSLIIGREWLLEVGVCIFPFQLGGP